MLDNASLDLHQHCHTLNLDPVATHPFLKHRHRCVHTLKTGSRWKLTLISSPQTLNPWSP